MPPNTEQQNPTPSPIVVRPTANKAIKAIRIFLLVLIVIGLGLIATEKLWVPKLVNLLIFPVDTPTQSPATGASTSGGKTLVLLYTTDATSTMDIWRKVGSSAPVVLATIPISNNFILSPDRTTLAVREVGNHSLGVFNLATKQLRIIFTSTNEIPDSLAFSPDSKSIALFDGGAIYTSTDVPSTLYSINVASGQATVLVQSNSSEYSDVLRWRPDEKLIIGYGIPKGTGGEGYAYFNQADRSIHDLQPISATLGGLLTGIFSKNGMLMTVPPVQDVTDPCAAQDYGEMGSPEWAVSVSVADPVSGAMLGKIGDGKNIIKGYGSLWFSPDNKKALYAVHDATSCQAYSQSPMYYVQDIGASTTPTLVADPSALLASWGADANAATTQNNPLDGQYNNTATTTVDILVDGKMILETPWREFPTIIAQYYQ